MPKYKKIFSQKNLFKPRPRSVPSRASRVKSPHIKWRPMAPDYPDLKEFLLEHDTDSMKTHCKHSIRDDKLCPYAQLDGEITSCALLVDWWDDWDVDQIPRCFALLETRNKINWRNIKIRELGLINERRRV